MPLPKRIKRFAVFAFAVAGLCFGFALAHADTVYYPNCAAARAAGAAPIMEGEPGYRPALDRDHDGIACE